MVEKNKRIYLEAGDGALDATRAVVMGVVKFRLKTTDDTKKWAQVLDVDGKVIGDANQMYGNGGWAVHTAPYAGYASADEVEFV